MMAGTSSAQYYIWESDTIEDPVPHQGDDYEMSLMTDRPYQEDCYSWWKLSYNSWLTVNYVHNPYWVPAGEEMQWVEFFVGVDKNNEVSRSGSYEIDYVYENMYTGHKSYEEWTYVPVSQSSGVPSTFECSDNPIYVPPDESVWVTFNVIYMSN